MLTDEVGKVHDRLLNKMDSKTFLRLKSTFNVNLTVANNKQEYIPILMQFSISLDFKSYFWTVSFAYEISQLYVVLRMVLRFMCPTGDIVLGQLYVALSFYIFYITVSLSGLGIIV